MPDNLFLGNGTSMWLYYRYADGDQVSGYLSQDWLTWAGLSVEEQIFAEISDAASFSLVCAEDGLMGMAFSNIADSNAATRKVDPLKPVS